MTSQSGLNPDGISSRYALVPSDRLRTRFGGPVERREQLWEHLPFVASFCADGDLLSMWRGYADGSGFAVEFDTDVLRDALDGDVDKYGLTGPERQSL